MNCAFCPHHKCYTSGQNCTRLTHEEISEYYTDEDKKMMRASSATERAVSEPSSYSTR